MSRVTLALLLLTLIIGSGVATVYITHRSRSLFVELQALQRDYDEMRAEWGRLQLEASTWASHDRVRSFATEQLDLHMPPGEAVIVVRAR